MRLLHKLSLAALACAAVIAFDPAVLAQAVATNPGATTIVTTGAGVAGDTTVTAHYGDLVYGFLTDAHQAILVALVGVATWAVAMLPGPVRMLFGVFQVDQVLSKAIDYGINSVAGAAKGKVLSVDVGNKVLATALQFVIDHAPASLVKFMGGNAMIAQKIIARLPLEEGAAISAPTTAAAASGVVTIVKSPVVPDSLTKTS